MTTYDEQIIKTQLRILVDTIYDEDNLLYVSERYYKILKQYTSMNETNCGYGFLSYVKEIDTDHTLRNILLAHYPSPK